MTPTPARQTAATAQAILDAAEELFAAQGFERTSIKSIGQAAGVNPALLYYYYANKASLYRAVLDRIGEALRERAVPAVGDAKSVEAIVRGVVSAQTAMLTRHPRAATLMIRELVDHRAGHESALINRLAAEVFRPACDAIEAGQSAGTIRPELDSGLAAISIISQVFYFVLAGPAVQILLDRRAGFVAPQDTAGFAEHAIGFAMAAIQTPNHQPNR